MATDQQVTLTAHCLCKAQIFTPQIPQSSLPLKAYICHCSSCRHTSGAMYTSCASLPLPSHSIDTSALQTYSFSDKISILFCGTCSTAMFAKIEGADNSSLAIVTGTIQNDDRDLVKYCGNIFVEDTQDGGATPWTKKMNADGSTAKCFKESSSTSPVIEMPSPWPPLSSLTGLEIKIEDAVPIRCKCQGVDLVLHRGNYAGKKDDELPWFIDPQTHKNIAEHCVCDSCRLFGGADVFDWTFAELAYISFPETAAAAKNKAFPNNVRDLKVLVDSKDPLVGTLTYYASSPGVQRYFCSECSACIFYARDTRVRHGTEDRSKYVDVAVGVLEASDGARAEGFLAWRFDEVDFTEDVKGGWREDVVEQVAKASKQFREERGYSKI